MKISCIHHISLLVSDLERSLDFYKQVFGLTPNDSRPDFGFPGAWLDLGDSGHQIHLMQINQPGSDANHSEHGGHDRHIAFQVHDYGQVISKLDHLGLPYNKSSSGRTALFIRDPDGNAFELLG